MVFRRKKNEDPDKPNNAVKLKLGPLQLDMKNMPKWPLILISIGIMFFLILYGHGVYMQKARVSRIRSIVSKLVHGKSLTEKDVEILESLTPEERKKMGNDIKKLENNTYFEVDGLKIEQNVLPGTKTTITRNGKEVSITKGASEDGD